VFGENDELGCLNFLTPEGMVDAARLVDPEKSFGWTPRSALPSRRCLAATPWRTEFIRWDPSRMTMCSTTTTLRKAANGMASHAAYMKYERFYGGVKPGEIKAGPGGRLSIHH